MLYYSNQSNASNEKVLAPIILKKEADDIKIKKFKSRNLTKPKELLTKDPSI